MKFLFPIVSILIAGALFFVFVQPLYGNVSQLKTEVAAYSSALSNSASLQKTQDTLLSQYKNVQQSNKDRLNDFLPNTVDNIEFILQIEQIANLYNMPLKNIKFDATQGATTAAAPVSAGVLTSGAPGANLPYGTFALEFQTQGTYAQFTVFLKDLEHNLRLVDVKSISFEVPPPPAKGTVNPPDPNVYDFTLKVDTYWLK